MAPTGGTLCCSEVSLCCLLNGHRSHLRKVLLAPNALGPPFQLPKFYSTENAFPFKSLLLPEAFPTQKCPKKCQFSPDPKGVGMDVAEGLVFQALLEIWEGERSLWTWSYFLLVIPSVPQTHRERGPGGGFSESCLLLPEA